jgi:hypothetical protein
MPKPPDAYTSRFGPLIQKLMAWQDHDFHADRQLADEVLIADGWTVTPDPTFEGGVRWQIGPVCASEGSRPHPIHSLDRALAVVPRDHAVSIEITRKGALANVWRDGTDGTRPVFEGVAPIASVAVLIAAFRAMEGVHVG